MGACVAVARITVWQSFFAYMGKSEAFARSRGTGQIAEDAEDLALFVTKNDEFVDIVASHNYI